MFSFFSKKKTPEVSPSEEAIPIPGANSDPNNRSTTNGSGGSNDDEFIMIEKKPLSPPSSLQTNLYPMMPPSGGYHQSDNINNKPIITPPMNYLHGVPFVLSATICQDNTFEVQQSQIDGILAIMTRAVQIGDEYDFSLERSISEQ